MDVKDPKKQAAAKARADALTQEDRSSIAKRAAAKRWAKAQGLPQALFASGETPLKIGATEIDCYVLDDGRRVLTQESFLTSIGRAAKAKGGQGVRTAVDTLPPFLAAANLAQFVAQEVTQPLNPIEFVAPNGTKVLGYAAEMLPEVCRVYLAARDAKALLSSQSHIAERADILVRALASVGIVALVDEATGYQEIRDKKALEALLDQYLAKEYARWAKRFPDSFYKEMFRLRNWPYPTIAGARPGVVGHYTMNIVYERLEHGLVKELETRNPKNLAGNRVAKHHQWLTEDVGHPALNAHIHAVTGLMRACDNWEQFIRMLDRSFPKKGDTLRLEGFE